MVLLLSQKFYWLLRMILLPLLVKQDTHCSCVHGTHILVPHENLKSNISKAKLTASLLNQNFNHFYYLGMVSAIVDIYIFSF